MYEANGKPFDSFKAAVAYANEVNCDVIEVATGIRRWHPAPPPSAAKMRQYRERQAAYAAQQRLNAMNRK